MAQAATDQDDGAVRWFGPTWDAPVNDDCLEVEVPVVGEPCLWCGHPIKAGDQGLTMLHIHDFSGHGASRVPVHLMCQLFRVGAWFFTPRDELAVRSAEHRLAVALTDDEPADDAPEAAQQPE